MEVVFSFFILMYSLSLEDRLLNLLKLTFFLNGLKYSTEMYCNFEVS